MIRNETLINKLFLIPHICIDKLISPKRFKINRLIVAIGFVIAMALAIMVPLHMTEPDDWAYYFGVQNFSQGQFTVDDQTHSQQVSEAQQSGGQLIQYVSIGDNKWALEKAPGYVLYLIPFYLAGIPRWGNVLLALGLVIVTFILLKRLRDEKTALIGCLLMLFNPVAMMMLNSAYMDTYASMAFLAMGGGLYIYYHLERHNLSRRKGGLLLALAFFLIGWSVVSRYTNLTVAAVLALHLILTRAIEWHRGERSRIKNEILPVVLGIGLPVLALGLYNYLVFGSPLDYGYHYTQFDISFAYQYLGQVTQSGQSRPLQIILNNLQAMPRAFLLGFPLLVFGIPALGVVLHHKFAGIFRKETASGFGAGLQKEMPWDILLVLIGWFIGTFFLYAMYEWTASSQGLSGSLISFDRFYLPGLFPIAVICALVAAKLPYRLYIPVTLAVIGFGTIIYAQWAFNLNILPNWLYNGSSRSGFHGDGLRNGFPGNASSDSLQPGSQPGNLPNRGNGYFPGLSPGGGFAPPAGQ